MTIGVVLMAYGTPASPGEIAAYYTDIRRGRPPTAEQLADLEARYRAIGGVSPLAQRTRAQAAALQAGLDALTGAGEAEVALGFKHASPTIEDAVASLATSGHGQLVGLVLAPHFSALSVGQYLDRLDAAASRHGIPAAAVRSWATDETFVAFTSAQVRHELAAMPANTKVLFTAHSLPSRIVADGDPYPAELRATATAVAARAGLGHWSRWATAWQSAGRTPEPWLGPDVLSVIDELGASENADGVLVSAVGFVADHLEVLYDLDVEAARRARAHGLAFARTACVNDDPGVFAALAARVVATAR